MHSSVQARNLIAQGRLREVSSLLDRELSRQPENDDLWYLRGIVSLKLNNHDYAQECFERAVSIKPKSQYHKLTGIAHMQMFQMEDAVEAFAKAAKLDSKDAEVHFFLSLCLMFLDDPRSRAFMQKAYLRDRKKVKELLKSFYKHFFLSDPAIKDGVKKEIEKKIESIR
jgi:tetratricopeptide (TPR) repeat protein